ANSGTLTLTSSTISRNFSTAGEFSGGIYSTGALTMSQSTVSENRVSGFLVCGGIASSGAATITDSTIRGNSGGLRVGPSTASGGGICNLSSGAPGLLMTNSTISGNSLDARGTLGSGYYASSGSTNTLTNVTIAGNSGTYFGPTGGSAVSAGAGYYAAAGSTSTLTNLTIAGNTIFGGTTGAGLYSDGATILRNSIVANNTSGGNCAGTITSGGSNLSSDATCSFTGPGDLTNTDPLLGPLQPNPPSPPVATPGNDLTQALQPG